MGDLLQTPARCPKCNAPPRIRIDSDERELAFRQPPAKVKQSYQCHRCGEFYPITAKDYQGAA